MVNRYFKAPMCYALCWAPWVSFALSIPFWNFGPCPVLSPLIFVILTLGKRVACASVGGQLDCFDSSLSVLIFVPCIWFYLQSSQDLHSLNHCQSEEMPLLNSVLRILKWTTFFQELVLLFRKKCVMNALSATPQSPFWTCVLSPSCQQLTAGPCSGELPSAIESMSPQTATRRSNDWHRRTRCSPCLGGN